MRCQNALMCSRLAAVERAGVFAPSVAVTRRCLPFSHFVASLPLAASCRCHLWTAVLAWQACAAAMASVT